MSTISMAQFDDDGDEPLEVRYTVHLDGFVRLKGNRPLVERHVQRIMRSMERRGFVRSSPIIVNHSFEVIDGQHRLEAARRLRIGVWWCVDENLGIKDVIENVSTVAKWTLDDFVRSRMEEGNDNYIQVGGLADEYQITINTAVGLLVRGSNAIEARRQVIEGEFEVSTQQIARAKSVLNHAREFEPGLGNVWRSSQFIGAVAILCENPRYSQSQMRDRLAYQQTKLLRCATTKAYVELLQSIYNFKTTAANRVDFIADHSWRT